MAIISAKGDLLVYDLSSQKEYGKWPVTDFPTADLLFYHNNAFLVIPYRDKIKIFALSVRRVIKQIPTDLYVQSVIIDGKEQYLYAIMSSFIISDSARMSKWNLDSDKLVFSRSTHSWFEKLIKISNEGNYLATFGVDNKIKVFSSNDGIGLMNITVPTSILDMAFVPQQAYLLSFDKTNGIIRWDLNYLHSVLLEQLDANQLEIAKARIERETNLRLHGLEPIELMRYTANLDKSVLIKNAQALIKKSQYDSAKMITHALLNKGIKDDWGIMNNIGWEYYLRGRFDDALFWYREALKADSLNAMVNFNIALIDIREKRYQQAFKRYQQLFILNKVISIDLLRDVISDLEELCRGDEEDRFPFLFRGMLHLRAGKKDQARHDLNIFLQSDHLEQEWHNIAVELLSKMEPQDIYNQN